MYSFLFKILPEYSLSLSLSGNDFIITPYITKQTLRSGLRKSSAEFAEGCDVGFNPNDLDILPTVQTRFRTAISLWELRLYTASEL